MSDERAQRPGLETREARLKALQEHIEDHRRRRAESKLSPEAFTTVDAVTGLPNRFGVLQSIEGALQWASRDGTPFAVMAVWIPSLSYIARREAAAVAEEAMTHAGAVLSAGLRAVDRVGRWDDALFVIVLAKLAEEDGARRVSSRLAAMLSAVPVVAGEREYQLDSRTACALVSGAASVRAEEVTDRLEAAAGSDDPSSLKIIHIR